ncbi:hypothetical protein HED63_23185 [Ochrobactrum cytisi]|nr:hypothetical protein [Brucella cytisi]
MSRKFLRIPILPPFAQLLSPHGPRPEKARDAAILQALKRLAGSRLLSALSSFRPSIRSGAATAITRNEGKERVPTD